MQDPRPTVPMGIQSTAGAIPIRNEKGELAMQKVKVHRYVAGKRPDYAPQSSSEEESEDDDFIETRRQQLLQEQYDKYETEPAIAEEVDLDDPRLRRLRSRRVVDDESIEEERRARHRHIHEPEVIQDDSEEEVERRRRGDSSEDDEEEDELSDEEIERRRQLLHQRVLNRKDEQEMEVEDEKLPSSEESAEESSEYEECSDSEEETGPRLKPVFVRKKDRLSVMEKAKEAQKKKQAEHEAKKAAEERRRQTLRMVEDEIRKEQEVKKNPNDEPSLNDIITDDENDEMEYEAWKLRELKRIKRDREEREQMERERSEIERLRNMTEEERRQEFRNNPKFVINKAAKGKYKFMQKYYHRGAFFMDHDDELFKRDFSAATLEDHFDKTILPKVMQVKNFGRSGRTKYTHLVDQDTTSFESPWMADTTQNIKFHNNQAAGMKQTFDKPSLKKRKSSNS